MIVYYREVPRPVEMLWLRELWLRAPGNSTEAGIQPEEHDPLSGSEKGMNGV